MIPNPSDTGSPPGNSAVPSGRRALRCAVLVALMLIWACAGVPRSPLEPASLTLPEGSRVLTARLEHQLLGFRLLPPSRDIEAPEGIEVVPLAAAVEGKPLRTLIDRILDRQPADRVLLLEATESVEKRYSPYQVFLGWRTESVIDGYENGRPVARKRDVPRFATEYRHRCIRVRYRILQYGRRAEPLGKAVPEPESARTCPEDSKRDVVIDEFQAAAAWLADHLKAAGQ